MPRQTEADIQDKQAIRRDDGSREAARDFGLRAAPDTLCSDPGPQFPHLKGENVLRV